MGLSEHPENLVITPMNGDHDVTVESLSTADFIAFLGVIVTGLGVIVTAGGVIYTIHITKQISNIQTSLNKRQILVPMWEYICTISRIKEGGVELSWNQIIATANKLELIALAWESELIDTDLLDSTIRNLFLEVWDDIIKYEKTVEYENGGKQTHIGASLIKYNKAAHRRYLRLQEEELNDRKTKPLKTDL